MKWMLIAIAALALAVPAFVVSAEDEPQKDEKKEEKKEEPKEPKKEETELPEDSLYRLKTKTLDGKDADLSAYKGKVALVVNVASK